MKVDTLRFKMRWVDYYNLIKGPPLIGIDNVELTLDVFDLEVNPEPTLKSKDHTH